VTRDHLSGLASLFDHGSVGSMSDAQLLALLSGHPGTDLARQAFSALVERHGPRVWGTCRLLLHSLPDAEDAFQATFLVLARRTGSIRVGESLAPWLLGVARKVCSRSARQARRFQSLGQTEPSLPPADLHTAEAASILRAEIARLPAAYREVITLCHLQGHSLESASEQLGRPVGTIKGHLHRARSLLRSRLSRRGLPLLLPPRLIDPTVHTALGLGLGPILLAGGVPAIGSGPLAASSLATGVLHAMTIQKFAMAVAGLLILASASGAFFLVQAQEPPENPSAPSISAGPQPAPTPLDRPIPRENAKILSPAYIVEPPDLLRIEVLEALPGRPITGERLVRPDGTILLDFYGEVAVAGLTTAQIKEKVIDHLRRWLNDETLGLVVPAPEGQPDKLVPPADSDRVFIEVSAYNSKVYYVQGEVAAPGRLVCTGNETVLDAISYAGGLGPHADPRVLCLVRPPGNPGNDTDQPIILPVDYDAIAHRGDPATNYQIFPGDRLIAYRDPLTVSPPPLATSPTSPAIASRRIELIEQMLIELTRELESLKQDLKSLPAPPTSTDPPTKP
jgi:RNA polymerase sigma factor (sigma-70 family)